MATLDDEGKIQPEKRKNTIPITNKFGKGKMLVSNMCSAKSCLRKSEVMDCNGDYHNCPLSIAEILKQNPGCGLFITTRNVLVNANYALHRDSTKIDFEKIDLTDGSENKLSRRKKEAAIRKNKKQLNINWLGFINEEEF